MAYCFVLCFVVLMVVVKDDAPCLDCDGDVVWLFSRNQVFRLLYQGGRGGRGGMKIYKEDECDGMGWEGGEVKNMYPSTGGTQQDGGGGALALRSMASTSSITH